MEFKISTGQAVAFCRKNWFKITVVALCLYIYFGKDFQFNLQVQVPEKPEQVKPSTPHEKMTENATAINGSVNRLELPFIGGRSAPKRNLQAELSAISEADKHAFLQRFANVARQEQERYDIPASVILATALHQSLAGKRDMALQAQNHFALPCGGEWRSACQSFQGKSYRKYETAWASFRDFSLYATEHFAELKGSNYASWAMGMQRTNFGEDEAFAKNLIQIIEGYRLQELDD